jgi:hypothetical protein
MPTGADRYTLPLCMRHSASAALWTAYTLSMHSRGGPGNPNGSVTECYGPGLLEVGAWQFPQVVVLVALCLGQSR